MVSLVLHVGFVWFLPRHTSFLLGLLLAARRFVFGFFLTTLRFHLVCFLPHVVFLVSFLPNVVFFVGFFLITRHRCSMISMFLL